MFICDKCKEVSQPGQKQNKVVTETRFVEYFEGEGDDRHKTGKGVETVKEVALCNKCLLPTE